MHRFLTARKAGFMIISLLVWISSCLSADLNVIKSEKIWKNREVCYIQRESHVKESDLISSNKILDENTCSLAELMPSYLHKYGSVAVVKEFHTPSYCRDYPHELLTIINPYTILVDTHQEYRTMHSIKTTLKKVWWLDPYSALIMSKKNEKEPKKLWYLQLWPSVKQFTLTPVFLPKKNTLEKAVIAQYPTQFINFFFIRAKNEKYEIKSYFFNNDKRLFNLLEDQKVETDLWLFDIIMASHKIALRFCGKYVHYYLDEKKKRGKGRKGIQIIAYQS